MLPLISIFGTSISSQDFWAGVMILGTLGGITTVCYIARTGKVWNVVGTLLVIFVVGGIISALR